MDYGECNFRTVVTKTDVTAIKILPGNYLLKGSGNQIYLYENFKHLIHKFTVFVGQKVHGIILNENKNRIAVYGGKHVAFFNIEDVIDKNTNIALKILSNDWILSLTWLQSSKEVALLTAHNVIQIWNISLGNILCSYTCNENCILYSGIILNISDHLLVMGGTVFSQVIIWDTKFKIVNNRLSGHKGVIFSITCTEDKNYIVTTSDDRSVKVWKTVDKHVSKNSLEYWSSGDIIDSTLTLFGHTARVMKSIIFNEIIVSIGEDSVMCVWNIDGKLILKKKVVKGGPLWSIDCDFEKKIAIIGGSDSSVSLCSIDGTSASVEADSIQFTDVKLHAKKAVITARGNIVCLTECGSLLYFSFQCQEWLKQILEDESSYQHLLTSPCRQYVTLGTNDGYVHIFVETCKFEAKLVHLISQRLFEEKLYSLHWIRDRILVACSASGKISLWGSQGQLCTNLFEYVLPDCKERWLTAVESLTEPSLLVAGDRCGSLHLYDKVSKLPIQSISRVHGRLGINSINKSSDGCFTVGRDKTVKFFQLNFSNDNFQLQFAYSITTPFEWVERCLDFDHKVVCGFKETDFIVWNAKYENSICNINCGGGHRSWDIKKIWKNTDDPSIANSFMFTFIKNYLINVCYFDFNKFYIEPISEGFHVNEVNCMSTLSCENDVFLITGGEDTIVNINILHLNNIYKNIHIEKEVSLKKHLSSIRCMDCLKYSFKICGNNIETFILFTAGGRAQICMWKLILCKDKTNSKLSISELGSYMLQGNDRQRKKIWKTKSDKEDNDLETRFMSLKFLRSKHDNCDNLLIAGCSDGYLRIYSVNLNPINDLCDLYIKATSTVDKKCILNVHSFDYKYFTIAITMTVNGNVSFWNITRLFEKHYLKDKLLNEDIELIQKFNIHKAGFNSFQFHRIEEDLFILISGGDDNTICFNLFQITDDNLQINLICNYKCENIHSCQITGIELIDSNYLITTSIDQRCTLFKWSYDKQDNLMTCHFISQYISSIADIQGINVLRNDENLRHVSVYGKGIEIFNFVLPLQKNH